MAFPRICTVGDTIQVIIYRLVDDELSAADENTRTELEQSFFSVVLDVQDPAARTRLLNEWWRKVLAATE